LVRRIIFVFCLAKVPLDVIHFFMAKAQTRRNFLLTAPLAAAVALPLTDSLLAGAQTPAGPTQQPEQFTADAMAAIAKGLMATNGMKELLGGPTATVSVTIAAESKKSGAEFEYHAHRDHVFVVMDGSTHYEVGGTPQGSHMTKEGEWLAPTSVGHKSMTLNKGDVLVVPRMTPHKRITEGSVSLIMINSVTPA
jgi:mannose-6-phosphate isomerase-like protein (cupin superfamily)